MFAMIAAAPVCAANAATEKHASAPEWLARCWLSEDGATREQWTAAPGGYLFGFSVTLHDGAPVFFEQLRIEPGPDGLVYQAYPRGHGPTAFTESAASETAITFENAAHDYPQKITYALSGERLTATISLIDGGKAQSWRYSPCA